MKAQYVAEEERENGAETRAGTIEREQNNGKQTQS
jgi:hypothetical protein